MVPLHKVKLEGSRDVEKLHFPVPYKAEMKLLCIKYILMEEETSKATKQVDSGVDAKSIVQNQNWMLSRTARLCQIK